jgi:YfiH family protein
MVTLPKPNGAFRWTQPFDSRSDRALAQGEIALVCDALEPFAHHFFTTRQWKLGERRDDSVNGWQDVALRAGVGPEHLGRLRQVHGADAVTYKRGEAVPGGEVPTADIAITDDPAVAVAVQTADCLPILFVDRQRGAVAAAHAGWRGLAARVPSVTIGRMAADFGTNPGDLLVAAGPAIGACCYEIGEEVRSAFANGGFTVPQLERWFSKDPLTLAGNPSMKTLPSARRPNHWFFDGWACVREQLESAGVPAGQIFLSDLCTASHEATLCSYRRDGKVAGRIAGVIRPGPLLR